MLQEQRSDLWEADNTSTMLTFMPAADTNTVIVIANLICQPSKGKKKTSRDFFHHVLHWEKPTPVFFLNLMG